MRGSATATISTTPGGPRKALRQKEHNAQKSGARYMGHQVFIVLLQRLKGGRWSG